ncbi:hypothetical protein L6452_01382 [Arctium lappa]|uniref:Uncharacterized protein n=1 Tax=Arctium lappa TaxID=4217 RepID=A0ACB9FHB6_ARCLA|nr:hypothetical protein L6452_01382 [Arctium lappa]
MKLISDDGNLHGFSLKSNLHSDNDIFISSSFSLYLQSTTKVWEDNEEVSPDWRDQGEHMHNILKDLLGNGILTVDGDEWREQRKDLFMKATTDSIFKVGFGIDVDNISGSSEEGVKFSRAFDDANALIYRRLFDMSWKIKKALNIGTESELQKNIKVIDDFVYKLIRTKIEQMNNAKDPLIKNTDPKYVRDIVVTFALAGKDPIATTLYWFIYMLCKHPEIQDKVAKEITDATNMNLKELETTNVAEFAARVSEQALDKMQYLHATLTETLRLYPALSLDAKICFSDDVLPDGCNVKKGDMVFYMPYAMGRMKFIWGEDAHVFRPERWLDHDGCFHPESPFKFTAFQADEDILFYLVGLLRVQIERRKQNREVQNHD